MESAEKSKSKDEHSSSLYPQDHEARKVKFFIQDKECYPPFALDDCGTHSVINCNSPTQNNVPAVQSTKSAMSVKNQKNEITEPDCGYSTNNIGGSQHCSSPLASNTSSTKQLLDLPYTKIQNNDNFDGTLHSAMPRVPYDAGSTNTGIAKKKRPITCTITLGKNNEGTMVQMMKDDELNSNTEGKCNKFCLSQFYFYFVSILFLAVCAFLLLTCYMLGNHIIHKG